MDLFEAIKKRRSVRQYLDKPVPKEVLEKLIDAARFAPTARHTEPWTFVVVTEPNNIKAIGEATDSGRFISKAAACIAVFCRDTKYYLEDGCAAIQNILLSATSLGIGSCWVAGDKKPYCEKIIEMLGAPADHKLIGLVSLGYPLSKDAFFEDKRKELKDLLHWNRF